MGSASAWFTTERIIIIATVLGGSLLVAIIIIVVCLLKKRPQPKIFGVTYINDEGDLITEMPPKPPEDHGGVCGCCSVEPSSGPVVDASHAVAPNEAQHAVEQSGAPPGPRAAVPPGSQQTTPVSRPLASPPLSARQ